MKNEQEILQKAIEKAWRNGYRGYKWVKDNPHGIGVIWANSKDAHVPIIFSHDFAKAFWGEDDVADDGYTREQYVEFKKKNPIMGMRIRDFVPYRKAWQYHLEQMVLEENPLQYLERFL